MNNTQQRNLLSISAIMFFALFVRKGLRNGEIKINTLEIEFVQFYIQLGLVNTTILMLCIGLFLLSYIFDIQILSSIGIGMIIFLISIIIIQILLVIFGYHGNISIENDINNTQEHNLKTNKQDRYNIIRNYMPFYTIYRWYNLANFDKPYRWIKESFFLRTIFTIVLLSQNTYFVGLIFFIILFRIGTLYLGIDIVSNKYKHKINSFFRVNPEEMFGYIFGGCKYLKNKYLFQKDKKHILGDLVLFYKRDYMGLYDINKNIILQYLILIVLILSLLIFSKQNFFLRLFVVFVLGRYILLLVFFQKLINLPIIYDVLKIFYQKSRSDETH